MISTEFMDVLAEACRTTGIKTLNGKLDAYREINDGAAEGMVEEGAVSIAVVDNGNYALWHFNPESGVLAGRYRVDGDEMNFNATDKNSDEEKKKLVDHVVAAIYA